VIKILAAFHGLEHPVYLTNYRSFQSSLSSAKDKESHALQLFEMYRQFDESLLRSAIKRLLRQKVLTYGKYEDNKKRIDHKNRIQFSQR